MINNEQILESNKNNYQDLYSKDKGFLRYAADWVIRFHNMYMKENLPSGRVLDYGCGSANNSIFFMQKGYEVYGVDVAKPALNLIKKNLDMYNLDSKLVNNFQIISPEGTSLPFDDNYFDFIISNQVLYYLPSEEHIKNTCKELARCLRPGGVVFFTMMGPKNYYITEKTKQIIQNNVHEIIIDDPNHRLAGVRELIYLVRDEEELKDLFSEFDCISAGYFDQRMFDMTSNFHWIFVGKNNK